MPINTIPSALNVRQTPKNGTAKVSKVSAVKMVSIPEIVVETVVIPVYGTTPYLSCAWPEDMKAQIEAKQKGEAVEARKIRDPEQEYKDHVYWTNEKKPRPGIPASAFQRALVDVCSSLKGVISKTLVRQAVQVIGDILPMEPIPGKEIVIDKMTHMCRPQMGVVMPVYRPAFHNWMVKMEVRYNAGLLSLPQLINLTNQAGFSVGVGAWRKQKGGQFGSFTAVTK